MTKDSFPINLGLIAQLLKFWQRLYHLQRLVLISRSIILTTPLTRNHPIIPPDSPL
jgi:hypothetical protein